MDRTAAPPSKRPRTTRSVRCARLCLLRPCIAPVPRHAPAAPLRKRMLAVRSTVTPQRGSRGPRMGSAPAWPTRGPGGARAPQKGGGGGGSGPQAISYRHSPSSVPCSSSDSIFEADFLRPPPSPNPAAPPSSAGSGCPVRRHDPGPRRREAQLLLDGLCLHEERLTIGLRRCQPRTTEREAKG